MGPGGRLPPAGAAPLFNLAKNDVNAVPSAKLSPVDHVYVLFTSLTLPVGVPPIVPVVCSHISPVFRSLTVPSPLSTERQDTPAFAAVASAFASAALKFDQHFADASGWLSRILALFCFRQTSSDPRAFSLLRSHVCVAVIFACAVSAQSSNKYAMTVRPAFLMMLLTLE